MVFEPGEVIRLLGGPTKAATRLNIAAGIPDTAPKRKRLTREAVGMWRIRGEIPWRWKQVVERVLADVARAA